MVRVSGRELRLARVGRIKPDTDYPWPAVMVGITAAVAYGAAVRAPTSH